MPIFAMIFDSWLPLRLIAAAFRREGSLLISQSPSTGRRLRGPFVAYTSFTLPSLIIVYDDAAAADDADTPLPPLLILAASCRLMMPLSFMPP